MSVYAERPWTNNGTASTGPFASAPEQLESERLQIALEQQSPTPQRQLFRPRFGYRTDAIGITDVINVDDVWRTPNDGNPGGYGEINSTQTNTFQRDFGGA